MVRLAELRIATRFRGPPGSGNGGYVAGLLATFSPFDAPEVRLLRPPPLETPLEVVAPDDDPAGASLQLRSGDELYATLAPGSIDFAPPPPPTPDEASAGGANFAGWQAHMAPGCFVCGPERPAGDGLRIFAGPPDAARPDRVVASWTPEPALAGTRGRVRPEFVWAALDCPGYFAVAPAGRRLLLGRLAVRLLAPLDAGRRCAIVGWRLGGEGRRHLAGTALYADGECLAFGAATWVEPRATA